MKYKGVSNVRGSDAATLPDKREQELINDCKKIPDHIYDQTIEKIFNIV